MKFSNMHVTLQTYPQQFKHYVDVMLRFWKTFLEKSLAELNRLVHLLNSIPTLTFVPPETNFCALLVMHLMNMNATHAHATQHACG